MTFEVAGAAYDRFMGRYSRPLAIEVIGLLDIEPGQRALDVGCGPGALTGPLVELLGADHVAAVDPSAPFVEACRARLPGVDVRQGVAESLPFADDAFDRTAACLVVHFMKDPVAGLWEMARVTHDGCWVAAAVWDLAGGRVPMAPVWSALSQVAPQRAGEEPLPGGSAEALVELMLAARLRSVESVECAITVTHPPFEEWWKPYLHGVGPVGEAIAALTSEELTAAEAHCRATLGDGPFDVTAVAHVVRGRA